MAAGAGFVVVLFLLLGLGIPIAIWVLSERETENRDVVSRADAEQRVRNDRSEAGTDERTGWDREKRQ